MARHAEIPKETRNRCIVDSHDDRENSELAIFSGISFESFTSCLTNFHFGYFKLDALTCLIARKCNPGL